jgi:hypothetical protein
MLHHLPAKFRDRPAAVSYDEKGKFHNTVSSSFPTFSLGNMAYGIWQQVLKNPNFNITFGSSS